MKENREELKRFFTGELPLDIKERSGSFFGVMVSANNLRLGCLGIAGAVLQALALYSLRDMPIMRDPLMRWFTLAAVIGLLVFGLFFLRQSRANMSVSSLWACQVAFIVYYVAVDLCILFLGYQMQQGLLQLLPVVLLGSLAVLLFAVLCAYLLSREQYRQQLKQFSLMLRTEEMAQSQVDLQKRLDRMTAWDDQTQMNNRRAMSSWLEAVWPLCVRNHIPVAVIMLSPDGMDALRKEKGSLTALRRLSQFAEALKPFVRRQSDFLGRYEEDKFIILYSGPSKEDADMLIRRIRDELNKHVWRDDAEESISLSVGTVYGLPKDNMVAAQWMTRADDALEKAKTKGVGNALMEEA